MDPAGISEDDASIVRHRREGDFGSQFDLRDLAAVPMSQHRAGFDVEPGDLACRLVPERAFAQAAACVSYELGVEESQSARSASASMVSAQSSERTGALCPATDPEMSSAPLISAGVAPAASAWPTCTRTPVSQPRAESKEHRISSIVLRSRVDSSYSVSVNR